MTYKKLMPIIFLLLVVLTIGAVSVADDIASDDQVVNFYCH